VVYSKYVTNTIFFAVPCHLGFVMPRPGLAQIPSSYPNKPIHLNKKKHKVDTPPRNFSSETGINRTTDSSTLFLLIAPTGPSTFTALMRLTAELIQSSLSYLNPLKERELDLRGASPS